MTLIPAILTMSLNPPSCERVLEPKATGATQSHPKATPRPHQGHILGIDSGVQRHPKAPPKPPQGSTKAPPRLHQGSTKAPPRLHQGSTKAPPRLHQGSTKAPPKPPPVPVQQKSRKLIPAFLPHSTLRTTLNLHLMPRRRFALISHTRSDYCVFASSDRNSVV